MGSEVASINTKVTYLIDNKFTQTITLRESVGNNLNWLLDENGKVIGSISIVDKYSSRTMQFIGGVRCLNINGEFAQQSGAGIKHEVLGFTNGFVVTAPRRITFLATSNTNQKFQQQLQGTELMTCGYLN